MHRKFTVKFTGTDTAIVPNMNSAINPNLVVFLGKNLLFMVNIRSEVL
ncbi:MAG TPA: hypothetical protein V6C58_23885 [Allocoleopsis sp.]